VSYFKGKDSSTWHTGIGTSKAVLYQNLYPHIDLRIYGVEQEIEYDFIVKPGGKVIDIGFDYQNAQGTKLDAGAATLDEEGNLVIQTAFGELSHTHPIAYQKIRGERFEVSCAFKCYDNNTFGFEVDPYNKDHDLIIDPLVIVYATYIGGKGGEGSTGVSVDSTGAAYLTCWVSSKNFPTKNALYPKYGGDPTDACITKLSPDGKSLVYSSYLGGPERDGPIDILVDETSAACITGRASDGFPLANPLQEFRGIGDAFVTKVPPPGPRSSIPLFSAAQAGKGGYGMDLDYMGGIYVATHTTSSDMPVKNAFQQNMKGGNDMYIVKLKKE
jgi:hypothetical protein